MAVSKRLPTVRDLLRPQTRRRKLVEEALVPDLPVISWSNKEPTEEELIAAYDERNALVGKCLIVVKFFLTKIYCFLGKKRARTTTDPFSSFWPRKK